MKKNNIFRGTQPEFLLIALTGFYWYSCGTLVNPFAIGLIIILVVQYFLRNDFLGVVIPILMVLASIYILLALFSEFGEFGEKNAGSGRLLLVGIPFILATIASSVLMIRKYTK